MANGHVEIPDPFANNNVASSNTDPTSQTAMVDDSAEFKLLMAYTQRRRPARAPALESPGQTDPPSTQATENGKEVKEEEKEKKKKRRRGAKGVLRMCGCVRQSVKSHEPSEPASAAPEPEFRFSAVNTGEAFSRFR